MLADSYITDRARLHAIAAEMRLRAVQSQLSLGFTFCAIAEAEIRHGRLNEAISVVNKLRHHADAIRIHLDEPSHLPTAAVPNLSGRLSELKERTQKIESHLHARR